jgi:hypothetical protein
MAALASCLVASVVAHAAAPPLITACPAPEPHAKPPYRYPKAINAPWPDGGWPALPPTWAPEWGFRASTMVTFIGNQTGPMGAGMLHAASSLGIAGLGWQMQDQLPTDAASSINVGLLGRLEQNQAQAARALKQARPGVRVMVSADMDCTAAFWGVSKRAMANQGLASELFLHWPNGSIFLDAWGDTPAPWWNYSNPVAAKFWMEQGPIAVAMNASEIDGVYLDGADVGVRHGRAVSAYDCHVFSSEQQQTQYIEDSRVALWAAIEYHRKLHPTKWLTGYVASSTCTRHAGIDCTFHCPADACAGPTQLAPLVKGRRQSPNPLCAPTMRALIANSERENQTVYLEPAPLATVKCAHMDWTKPLSTFDCTTQAAHDPQPYVGAFLVSRGPSAILQLAVQPMLLLDYRSMFPSLRLEPGAPMGIATEEISGEFVRHFQNMSVHFSCNNFSASFLMKSDDESLATTIVGADGSCPCLGWCNASLRGKQPLPGIVSVSRTPGDANCTTIQGAINLARQGYRDRYTIQIAPGLYNEKLVVAANRPPIMLLGMTDTQLTLN